MLVVCACRDCDDGCVDQQSFRTKLSETLAKLTATEGLLAATEAENKKLRVTLM